MGERVSIEIPEPRFDVFETERENLPAVVVVNAALAMFEHREVFGWHLSIVIEAKQLGDNRMPTGDEITVIAELEDLLAEALEAPTEHGAINALLLARTTWDGTRDLHYRVHNPEIVDAAIRPLLDGWTKREWGFEMRADNWEYAEPFVELVRSTRN